MSAARTVVVLAAGKGKRMKSALPKTLFPMLGRTLLGHVMHATETLAADQRLVVVGHGADETRKHLDATAPDVQSVFQAEQLGTGHAVRTAMDAAPDAVGTVVVLYGDTPLLQPQTLAAFMAAHEEAGNTATVLSAIVDDPTGLGRIVRNDAGEFSAIVEQRDASPQQLAITEVNSGIYAFDAGELRNTLGMLKADNEQGEEYLTDVLGLLRQAGHQVDTHTASDSDDTLGCNDRAQLAQLQKIMQQRINTSVMRSGVTMDDPDSVWLDATVSVEADVTIRPGVQLRGTTSIAASAEIGPDSTLVDTVVGEGARIQRAHCEDAVVGDNCQVGPFAYLRPAARLESGAKVGTYVEVKKSTVASGAKVPHLSYVGDASIGANSNIGAGTIVANYDGVNKHATTVGEAVFVGSNSVLVAPVTVADGAYVAAGSAISQDVPSGTLGVARGRQHNSDGWVAKRRAGTKTDDAAKRAEQG